MPLEDLLNAIEAEAEEEVARLQREGEREAEVIFSAARAEAGEVREEILRAHGQAAEAEAGRRLALARLEADRLRREARDAAFRDLLDAVRDRLSDARGDGARYREALGALLREALVVLPDAAVARVDPDDVDLAADVLRALGAGLPVEPDPGVGGGVVLESAGGRVVRNTFGERLAGAEPALRAAYGRRLDALLASGGEPRGAAQ